MKLRNEETREGEEYTQEELKEKGKDKQGKGCKEIGFVLAFIKAWFFVWGFGYLLLHL
mgnify:CR=1 FL=1